MIRTCTSINTHGSTYVQQYKQLNEGTCIMHTRIQRYIHPCIIHWYTHTSIQAHIRMYVTMKITWLINLSFFPLKNKILRHFLSALFLSSSIPYDFCGFWINLNLILQITYLDISQGAHHVWEQNKIWRNLLVFFRFVLEQALSNPTQTLKTQSCLYYCFKHCDPEEMMMKRKK